MVTKSRRRLFDVPDSWYEDYDHIPFYQDHGLPDDEFKRTVDHWRKAVKEMSYGQLVECLADNRDEFLPINIALRPVLDRRTQEMQRARMAMERKQAWLNCSDKQLEVMVKRRMRNKAAVDHIKDEERFLNALETHE